MTFGECFQKVLKLLNYYSSGGAVIAESDGARADLRVRAAALIDTAQTELSAVRPIYKQVFIACRALENRISGAGFHRSGEAGLYFALPDAGARALSLRTAFPLTVTVRQGSETLFSVVTEDTAHMKAYTAVLAPQGTEPVTLTVTGAGLVADLALYREAFSRAEDVPVFGMYRDYALPEDFRAVERVDLRPALGLPVPDTRDYRLREGRLALPWRFEGEARLTYAAYPEKLGDAVPDTQLLSVDDAQAQAAVYFAASGLVAEENPELARRFAALYRELLEKASVSGGLRRIVPALFAAPRGRRERI